MSQQVHFGIPMSATTYRPFSSTKFACWSIPALTYSNAMFALAKFYSATTCIWIGVINDTDITFVYVSE